jgi:Resolvase, N terminal domain
MPSAIALGDPACIGYGDSARASVGRGKTPTAPIEAQESCGVSQQPFSQRPAWGQLSTRQFLDVASVRVLSCVSGEVPTWPPGRGQSQVVPIHRPRRHAARLVPRHLAQTPPPGPWPQWRPSDDQARIIYVRTAADYPAALERQRAACRQFARANHYAIIGEYAEVGSGRAVLLQLREQAIERAAADNTALVCQQSDRLSRSTAGFESILAECERAGVQVLFACAYAGQGTDVDY